MLLATVLLTAGMASVPDLPARFAGLLEGDDRRAVVAAAVPPADLDTVEWVDLREALDLYECIDVRASEATPESLANDVAVFRIALTATAVTAGAPRRQVLLPRLWRVAFAKQGSEWRMQSAMTLERHVVERMFAATDPAEGEEILRAHAHELDLSLLARAAARLSTNTEEQWTVAWSLGAMSGDAAAEAYTYGVASSTYARGRVHSRAREYARKSRELAQQSGSLDAIARSLHATGYVQWWANEPDEALATFSRAAAMVDTLDDPRIALKPMQMAGLMESARGNLYAAAPFWDRSVELSRRYGWIEGELAAAVTVGGIQGYLGDRELEETIYREVIRRAEAVGWRHVTRGVLASLADSQTAAKDYAAATETLRRLSEFTPANEVATKLGNLAMARGFLGEAECHYQSVRRDRNAFIALEALVKLGALRLREKRYEEALALAHEAAAIWATTPPSTSYDVTAWLPPLNEGKALRALGRTDEAAAAFEKAIALIEAQSTTSGVTAVGFLRDRSDAYLDLLQLHAASGDVVASLAIGERLKARVLKDVLANGSVDLRALLTAGERAEEDELNRRVEELNRAIASGRASADLHDALLRARMDQQNFTLRMQLAHPELRRASPPQVDAAAVRRWLDGSRLVPSSDSIVLSYLVAEEETILFALTRDTARMLRLPLRRDDLRAAVARLSSRIERRDLGYTDAAEELYRLLIEPAGALLAGKRRVCVIPHGPLWQVPFAVLRAPDGRHLIERVAIHYAPSLSFLDLTADDAERWLPEKPRVLALGNPAIGSESRARVRSLTRAVLGDLPEAEREARSIGKLYRAEVLLERAATEEAVKSAASKQDIIHFATHGISHTGQPLYSSLVLAAGSREEDGLLEAREIVRMNVPARLAVLSACETARGSITEGEGVIGLSWAFLVAGCSRTVATQWRADSAAAMKAMVELHRRIAGTPGGGSVPGALRQAQLSLLRTPRYSHPYYWGGFVVVGAGW